MKPCIWSSPYFVMVKSNMAAKNDRDVELIIIIISNYIKVRPKASRAGFVCRTAAL